MIVILTHAKVKIKIGPLWKTATHKVNIMAIVKSGMSLSGIQETYNGMYPRYETARTQALTPTKMSMKSNWQTQKGINTRLSHGCRWVSWVAAGML